MRLTWRIGATAVLVAAVGVPYTGSVVRGHALLTDNPTNSISSTASAPSTSDRLLAMGFENSEMAARPYSVDGNAFNPVPGAPPLANPDPAYGVRDPSLATYRGYYYLTATKPRKSAYLGTGATAVQLYRSANTVDWVPLPDIPAGVAGTTRAWAPELLVDRDDTVYVYYAVTTDTTENAALISTFDIYARRATNGDLTSWAAPVKMVGLITPKVIDPQVTRVDDPRGTYVMFYKDEAGSLDIARAWSNNPLGPWTTDRTGHWLGHTTPAEGPQLMRRDDGGWRLYYDHYANNQLSYRDSSNLDSWSAETNLSYSPPALRHPGFLWLTADQWVDTLSRRRAVRVYTATPRSIPNNQITAVPFSTPQGDTELWSAAQPTRLVAPEAGWYSVDFTLGWTINTSGQRSTAFRFSRGSVMQWKDSRPATGGGMGTEHGGSDRAFYLAAGEYIEIIALQTSGVTLTVNSVVSFTKESGN